METPEPTIAVGCSPQGGTLKEEKHSDSEMVQRDHFPGTKDKIPLTERPHRDDLRSCPSNETQTVGAGTSPTLQASDQNPIYTCRKTQRFPPPGKRCFQSSVNLLSVGVHKKEMKVKKTGKYVCHYCGRACAKPSVLKKHIRSHTGERPYPCVPCGFSFKTKSNLYKHRKSHTHAVKAGLFPFSEQDRKLGSVDEEVTVGEGEMHSDAEQSTDTDEEVREEATLAQRQSLHKGSSIQMKDRGDTIQDICGRHKQKIPGITFTQSPSNESTLGKVSLWQFREMMTPVIVTQVEHEIESTTIKQRLALRLSEKRSQDSLSLPSSYSKGSTDSGYFSRSESAEQQCNQASANAKSYQEIMFGKCYRPSAKPRQSITVQTCMTDINESPSSFMIKLTKGMAPEEATCHLHRHKKDLARSIKIESESFQEEEYKEIPEIFQCRTELLETPPEYGLLLRSNSLPTPSESNVSASQVLRSSNSFDERMTNDEISFRSSMGMRKLMRQAAFEHSAHEGHAEPDNHTLVCGLKLEPKVDSADDSKIGIENCPESESCLMFQNHMMENATRKRRKGKNIMEDEDFPTQNKPSCLPDLTWDLCTKQDIPDATYTDTERWSGSNVISVIQHTKSLSRLSSAEKSIDFESQQFNKNTLYQLIEKEQIKEKCKTDPLMHSGKIESQYSGSSLIYQWSQLSKQLAFQSGIQVPEIRVTEEPDKPEKVRDMQVRPNEKNREEFQWPQRSETLSNFPVEKLPPKKKRLRLAEMECSSGESSFESACTSLSRSPSQDSNLSHSSSFSQSLDREEAMNVPSPAKSDEFSKCLEFLSVPGSSLSQQREMRRSASEQAPCNLSTELPEFRSKSFDYSNLSLSNSPIQSEIYASDCGFKERRRGCLVRQASLSGDPEALTHDKSMEMNAIQGSSEAAEMCRKMSSPDKQFLLEGSSGGTEKMRYLLVHGSVSPQQLISPDLSRMPEQIPHKQPLLSQTLQMHQYHGLKQKIKKEPEDLKSVEDPRIALADLPKDHSQSVTNVLSTIAVLSQAQPALANPRIPGLLVPVRIQMQVPCYGNITYTSISHILDSQYETNLTPNNVITQSKCLNVTSQHRIGLDACQTPGHPRGLLHNPPSSPAKLNTGIPLSLTSRTISTTEAPSGGASKRMLSPASSIELFIEATQQKRVKDENMYGQIVEELSAVELGHPDLRIEKQKKETKSTHVQNPPGTVEEIEMEDSNIAVYNKARLPLSSSVPPEAILVNNLPIPVQIAKRDIANTWILSQFPGLHTTTCVSWCYLNSSKPNTTQSAPNFSVYASWFMRCHNPNPPNLSTGKALALLQSKQKKQNTTYTIAAMYQPGILVTSTLSSHKQKQGTIDARVEDITYDTQMKDIKQKCKPSRDNSKETEAPLRQTEPARVKIFEGGYKSNEDYVYVRGRGRGKYICEECGIRCKKPSMLKKHIRTHTDVRPYICKCCNFAFKTKGNLTKHMKSKAHLKKCLELGVSPMNMDNTDVAEHEDDAPKSSEIRPVIDAAIKHQFSDADDSDVGEEDGDEPDDDEDDEYDGDSTPRTHSRSTSPQPYTINKPFPSTCFTKNLDPKESFDASSVSNEDDLILEQTSNTFDPCTSQLLSPCWDSPHQRNICIQRDLSQQGHLAPGRAPSPLRPLFSRQDVNIRGDLSPIRQLSPVRPISPGTDASRYRTSSPRGHRGMLRAASPRRGTYQHRCYVELSREMKCEASTLIQTTAIYPETVKREAILQNVTDGVLCETDASILPSRGIFSHLPLHSQQQVQTPIPMVPIGGLRMPSVCTSGVPVERHSHVLPQGDISERANTRQASVSIPGPGVSNISSQRKEQPTSCTGLASKDNKQEESVHICAEAIASLRITSEDIIGNPPKS
ncbi:transcription factor HIVEP2 [Tachysurus fulvidraco]|uniref:transcription factor HIVEP2 n=1 Tax=Tachysurus fulvidraco TaxID=1234273 RepID=UPI001FEDA018|nr:transcription factor HIVEP2 [Tachysurus fulvidraco]XP_027028007.2 transcription factor HIVEP2 [Tachysurus fulvidraco]XP_047677486.1 transcription factor HIVEP2 [Tachysurus fulvidraco]XP_047677487.1 transcription factor HIVEP2 [Tachysurus fulvidraco]XP_047677488.1 transcription factor HIVEP2 [Tachysurus fulvidraco]